MILHNFCIDHGLSTEIDIVEDDFLPEVIEEHSYNGNFLREKKNCKLLQLINLHCSLILSHN